MPEIRADLFLNVFVNFIIFKPFTFFVPSWPRFEKVDFSTLFKELSFDSEQTSYQNTFFIISF